MSADGLASHGEAHAWELRTAWATQREVTLRLSERASLERVRGYVIHVAASGAYVEVSVDGAAPLHVPLSAIRSVHVPHFHEPDAKRLWRDAPVLGPGLTAPIPGQLALIEPMVYRVARVYHFENPGVPFLSACGRSDLRNARDELPAGEVPDRRRCRAAGCGRRWA